MVFRREVMGSLSRETRVGPIGSCYVETSFKRVSEKCLDRKGEVVSRGEVEFGLTWLTVLPPMRTRLDGACRQYQPGGMTELRIRLTRALDRGLSCLTRGGENRRRIAGRMLGFMDPGRHIFRVSCTSSVVQRGVLRPAPGPIGAAAASAHRCTSSHFPGMNLDLAQAERMSERELESTFFYEMLHTAGYWYGQSAEIPIGANVLF